MREIKFRAWDNEDKKWLSDIAVYGDGQVQGTTSDLRDLDSDYDNIILMQYTGLKDKNGKGKEAYFGDIAKDKHGQIFEIIDDYKFLSHLEGIWFEVIGNIYENPELIK